MKKILITIFLLFICSTAHAATTWFACSGGGNWNGASVWTSILADEVGCTASTGNPVAGDTAVLNSSSGNVTITTAAAAASLTMTGYTGTLGASTSQTLTVSGGTVTLDTGNTISSNITLSVGGTETLTFGSKTWPGPLTFSSASTVTLSNSGSTSIVSGLVNYSSAANLAPTTSETLTANGGLSGNSGTTSTAGIILGGGTWTGSVIYNPVTLAGNVTITGFFAPMTSITYSSGNITLTSTVLNVNNGASNGSITLTTNGIVFPQINMPAGSTVTMGSDIAVTTIQLGNNIRQTFLGAHNATFANVQSQAVNGSGFTFPAGQTLNVTNQFMYCGVGYATTLLIQSGTSGTPFFLNYTGPLANEYICGVTFTDVYANGPPPGYLINYIGANGSNGTASVLTRTLGINNVGATNINKKAINYYNGV